MIGQALTALFFAAVCGALSYGTGWQTWKWNKILGEVQWDQTIAGYFLSAMCGLLALGLFGFALVCAFQAGYHA